MSGNDRHSVFITGADGFIGRALVPALVSNGVSVTRGRRQCDASHSASPAPLWQGQIGHEDVVIHLAAQAHGRARGRSMDALRTVNVDATVDLARQARDAGVRQFIYLSSIGVLGAASRGARSETDPPAPVEPYARSKHEAEVALRALGAESDMAVTVIRPPLVYGPGAPGSFGRLLAWAQTGRALPLGAVTANRRSFLGRYNLVDFIQHALMHPQAANQIFHVADAQSVSTRDLLCLLAHAAGHEPRLWNVPPSLLRAGARLVGRGDTAQRLLGSLTVDSRKAREQLGWQPPLTLEQGLSDAVREHAAGIPV